MRNSSHLHILLVETEPPDSGCGCQAGIVKVQQTQQALERLKREDFDLILLQRRPVEQELKEFHEAAPGVPLLVLHEPLDEQLLVRRKNEFVAMLSHELRNPMTGIVGFVNLLSKTQLDDVQRQYVEAAQEGCKVLLGLLNGLLNLSSLESGHIHLELQPLDLRECLESSAIFNAVTARERGLEMVVSVDPRIPDLVLADEHRLRQVVNNLLGNAIKFTDVGYVALFARLRSLSKDQAVVRFVIEDSGRGIPAEKRSQIFQAFVQAHPDDRENGAGLGLAICKELISAMGGVLGVSSELGQGTVFWFDLHFKVQKPSSLTESLKGIKAIVMEAQPQARYALEFALTEMGASLHTRASECDWVITDRPLILNSTSRHLIYSSRRDPLLPDNAHSLSRPLRLRELLALTQPAPPAKLGQVLVVDDDPLCRTLVAAVAHRCGLNCDEVGDGAGAALLCSQQAYQMIFIDQQLPDCSGSDLASRLRQQGYVGLLVSLSGCLLNDSRFDGSLLKPVDPSDLEDFLELSGAIDWQVLGRFQRFQRGSHTNLVRELVETFVGTAGSRIRALQGALQAHDSKEVKRLAHLLKGTAASVGAVGVAAAAKSLEDDPREDTLFDALDCELERSLRAFQGFLKQPC